MQAVKYNFPHRLRKGATLVFSELLDSSGSLKVVQGAMGQTCRHTHHTYKSKHRQLCTDAFTHTTHTKASTDNFAQMHARAKHAGKHTTHTEASTDKYVHRQIMQAHVHRRTHTQVRTDRTCAPLASVPVMLVMLQCLGATAAGILAGAPEGGLDPVYWWHMCVYACNYLGGWVGVCMLCVCVCVCMGVRARARAGMHVECMPMCTWNYLFKSQ